MPEKSSFDCSSSVYLIAHFAGIDIRASTDSTGTGTSFKRAIRGEKIRGYIDTEQCVYDALSGGGSAFSSRSWLLVV